MSYAHKLKYAGSEPFEPERERDDISHEEYELLTQDETYQRLAEVRWLADDLESDLGGQVFGADAHAALFDAVGVRDAPLQEMVDEFVDAWLSEYRDAEEVSA